MVAPGRGRWERHLSAEARHELQRRRVLDVLPHVIAEFGNAFTVDEIVEAAGVGRNTFYAFFDDASAATAALLSEVREALADALDASARSARTPIERIRGVATAWVRTAAEKPALAVLAHAEAEDGGVNSALREHLAQALAVARAAGTAGRIADPLRLEMIIGAFDAAALYVAASPDQEAQARDALADLVMRFFR
jgi:AcrR family transcriptional regulator